MDLCDDEILKKQYPDLINDKSFTRIRTLIKLNNSFIAFAGDYCLIEIWDIEKNQNISNLKGHTGIIFCCMQMSNQHELFSCGNNGECKIWDIVNYNCLMTLKDNNLTECFYSAIELKDNNLTECFYSAIELKDHRIVVGSSVGVKIWNREKPLCPKTLIIDDKKTFLNTVSIVKQLENSHLATGSMFGGIIKIWDVENFNCLITINNHDNGFFKGMEQLLGDYLICDGSKLNIWSLKNGELVAKMKKCYHITTFAQLQNHCLATVSSHGLICIYDIKNGSIEPFFFDGYSNLSPLVQISNGDFICVVNNKVRIMKPCGSSNDWGRPIIGSI
jgi:WD40 repeat protein